MSRKCAEARVETEAGRDADRQPIGIGLVGQLLAYPHGQPFVGLTVSVALAVFFFMLSF